METIEVCPVILAGGSGTRLWPMSRELYPKQLLRLQGERSLLQDTVLRLDGIARTSVENAQQIALAAPIIVCNEEHRFLIAEQLEGIGQQGSRILLEPAGRNTAPALTIAASLARLGDQDPLLLVMPSDHIIPDHEAFHSTIRTGIHYAIQGFVVTFGIVPTRAETGYGYIRKGESLGSAHTHPANEIEAFVEKPDADAVRSYLASGDYLWNSGLFLMRASIWHEAMRRYRPDVLAKCEQAFAGHRRDNLFWRLDTASFEACPSDSIDYAVMERLTASSLRTTENGAGVEPIPAAVVALDAHWSDVGSWPAVCELSKLDNDGNNLLGDVYAIDSKNSLLVSEHRLLTSVGVEDLIMIETADAVLVAHKSKSQQVKQVVEWLKASGREEGINHRRVYRPWGSYETLDAGDRFQVKRLTVKPGEQLSLQLHHHRAEHWVVVRGTAKVTRGEEEFLLTENESTFIPLGVRHRLENPGTVVLELIEVQSGSYLGEDDIVRFEDRYDRIEDC